MTVFRWAFSVTAFNRIKVVLILLAGFGSTAARAQAPIDSATVARCLTAATGTYLGAQITQERGVGRYATVLYGLGGHYSFYSTTLPIGGTRFVNVVDPSFGRDYSTAALVPFALLEGRWYTSLQKRATRQRNTRHNAANYLGLFVKLPLASGQLIDVPNLQLARVVGLRYGVRRNLGKRIGAEGSLGVASKLSRSQRTVLPRLDGGVSWLF
ncbi:hypothetical protein [Hymenobacter koreensis]|uniref:Outer membrane protein beta-barrel domain-containing protein n=1 Tax=Hymenobacter koreensis TaxID=1084523 RepID=A0ABP8IV86_9BACT